MRYQFILLVAAATTGINAAHLANFVPRDNMARGVNVLGGWSLAQTLTPTCPADAPLCGAQWCCPSLLACVHTASEDIGEVCCPTDQDCSANFKAVPTCADSSWSLWNATLDTADQAGYFCCLQGQIGLQSGYCVDKANVATAGPPALQISTGKGSIESATATGSGSGVTSVSVVTSTSISVSTSSASASTASVTVASSTGGSSSTGSSSSTGGSSTALHHSGSANSAATGTATQSAIEGSTTTNAPPSPPASSSAVVTGKSGAERLGAVGMGGLVAGVFAVVLL